ncbi:hypothetical protein PG994_002139 [Apiospora phragmitis]|uniref:F-box domain-containing protein n=1 Tax=Apiospora phragmitis TaxID=2905665 RepID=A0ABR1WVJ1_9PEZI
MPELPLEVWSNIASALQLQPMRVGDYAPDSTFLARRACLRNLCRTSSKLAAAAQPWLYETIILYANPKDRTKGPESLVQLLRSLVASPSLRRHIRHLACALNLWPIELEGNKQHRDGVLQEWRAMRDVVEDSPPAVKRPFVQAALLEPSDQVLAPPTWPYARHVDAGVVDAVQLFNDDSQAPQKLLAILLCFTPKLQTLLLQGSSHADSPIRPFSDLLQYFLSQGSGDQSPVLPLLSTVLLQPDRSTLTESWTGVQVCQDFLAHLPSLRRLDQWKTRWARGTDNLHNCKWVDRLEEVHVAIIAPLGDIAHLVEQARALRTLGVDCVTGSPRYRVPTGTQRDLNQALLQRAATLVQLRITGILHDFRWLGVSLWCLSQLHRLEDLGIEYQQLVRPGATAGEVRVPDLLPPNLRRLKLLFLQGCDTHFETFMLTFPLDLQFARAQGRLKRLQKIHLEVFSATNIDDPKQIASIEARVVAILALGCIFTYTLNRHERNTTQVEPWALHEFL